MTDVYVVLDISLSDGYLSLFGLSPSLSRKKIAGGVTLLAKSL